MSKTVQNDFFLGRRYNPNTHCYEAPGRKPIPAEHVRFPMNGVELMWILITYE